MWTVISYVGLGSAGVISTFYLLWRKSVVENERDAALARASSAEDNQARAKTELTQTQDLYKDQLARRDAEIIVLRTQRKNAIDALEKSSAPGGIRDALRLSLGVSEDASAVKP